MTLSGMLSTLGMEDILVSAYNSEDKLLIKFFCGGYGSVDPTILTRTITEWSINVPHSNSEPVELKVVLGS